MSRNQYVGFEVSKQTFGENFVARKIQIETQIQVDLLPRPRSLVRQPARQKLQQNFR